MVDGVIYFPKEQKEKGNYLNDYIMFTLLRATLGEMFIVPFL